MRPLVPLRGRIGLGLAFGLLLVAVATTHAAAVERRSAVALTEGDTSGVKVHVFALNPKLSQGNGKDQEQVFDETDDDDPTFGGSTVVLSNKNNVDTLLNKEAQRAEEEFTKQKIANEHHQKDLLNDPAVQAREQMRKKKEASARLAAQNTEAGLKEKTKLLQAKLEEEDKYRTRVLEAEVKRKTAVAEAQGKKAKEQSAKAIMLIDERNAYTEEVKNAGDLVIDKEWDPKYFNQKLGYTLPTAYAHKGLIMVDGLLKGNNTGGLVATLDGRARPTAGTGRMVFTLMRGNVNARVDVLEDGRIYLVTEGNDGWVSLSGISYAAKPGSAAQLMNNWVAFGDGYRAPSINEMDGLCILSGVAKDGDWGKVIVAAPPSCMPRRRMVFSSCNHDKVTRLDITYFGQIVHAGGYTDYHWVSLDGIQWTPEIGTKLPLESGWSEYGPGWSYPSFKRIGPNICVLSGLLKTTGWSEHIATLPAECRPQKRLVFGGNVHFRSARVDILPDGRILYVTGKAHNWISLDGIRFVGAG